jgi:hypothetical protein
LRALLIEGIAHHGRGCNDADHHIKKVGIILPQYLPVSYCPLSQTHQLMATLTEAEKKRQKRGAQEQPVANLD